MRRFQMLASSTGWRFVLVIRKANGVRLRSPFPSVVNRPDGTRDRFRHFKNGKIFRYRSAHFAVRIRAKLTKEQNMPEQRGKQATADVKSEWTRAYQIYLRAHGDRYDKKKDRTARIDSVANELRLTRKQAKRRVRNYEAWQRNIKKGLVEP